MAKSQRHIVSFELPELVYEALQEDAAARGSNSVHQRARELLLDHFANRGVGELQEQLAALDGEVAWLGVMVRRVAYAVIVHAAGKDSDVANAWVRENMPHNPESS